MSIKRFGAHLHVGPEAGLSKTSASRCRLVGDVEAGLTKKVEIRGEERTVRIWPNSLEELRGEIRLHL